MSAHSRLRSAGADGTVGGSVWRTHLKRIGIEQRTLTDKDAQVLSLTISGWQVIPSRQPAALRSRDASGSPRRSTHADATARPTAFGHPAQLDDRGQPIDSVILRAVIQRHFLPVPEPALDDVALARQLGVKRHDIARAQLLIDRLVVLMRRTAAPLGAGWWKQHG